MEQGKNQNNSNVSNVEPKKFFTPVSSNESTTASPAVATQQGIRANSQTTFDDLIASLDDMLDPKEKALAAAERSQEDTSEVFDSVTENSQTLDNSALKARAKLQGPRKQKTIGSRSENSIGEIVIDAGQQRDLTQSQKSLTLGNENGENSRRQTNHSKVHGGVAVLPLLPPNGRESSSLPKMRNVPHHMASQYVPRPPSSASTISQMSEAVSEGSLDLLKKDDNIQYANVPLWSCDNVTHWLEQTGLNQLTSAFTTHQIDGQKILNIDNDKLREMGILDKVQVKLVKKRLKELKARHEKEKKIIEKSAKSASKQKKTGKLKSMFG